MSVTVAALYVETNGSYFGLPGVIPWDEARDARRNMSDAKITDAPTIRYDIFIGGDVALAKQVCREFCFDVGLCVTVEHVTYIYTGGEEIGVRVGLINYPRFPTTQPELRELAFALADRLMLHLCQHSYSVVGPEKTEWFSRRPQ